MRIIRRSSVRKYIYIKTHPPLVRATIGTFFPGFEKVDVTNLVVQVVWIFVAPFFPFLFSIFNPFFPHRRQGHFRKEMLLQERHKYRLLERLGLVTGVVIRIAN